MQTLLMHASKSPIGKYLPPEAIKTVFNQSLESALYNLYRHQVPLLKKDYDLFNYLDLEVSLPMHYYAEMLKKESPELYAEIDHRARIAAGIEKGSHTLPDTMLQKFPKLSDVAALRTQMGKSKVKEIHQMQSIFKGQPLTQKLYHMLYQEMDEAKQSEVLQGYATKVKFPPVDHLIQKAQEKYKDAGLTDNEARALIYYTGSAYADMNGGTLRPLSILMQQYEGAQSPEQKKDIQSRINTLLNDKPAEALMIQLAMQAMAKLPKFNGVVTRSMSLSSIVQGGYKEGAVVYDPAFNSASKGLNMDAKNLSWKDYSRGADQGVFTVSNGVDITDFSIHPTENEVLIPPGTMFKTDLVLDRYHVDPGPEDNQPGHINKRIIALREIDADKQIHTPQYKWNDKNVPEKYPVPKPQDKSKKLQQIKSLLPKDDDYKHL